MITYGKLIYILNNGSEQTYLLSTSVVTIGRSEDNDITLPDKKVSGRHARLQCDAAGCTIVDTHSTNGTFVNNQQVYTLMLQNGDMVRLGDCLLRFEAAA